MFFDGDHDVRTLMGTMMGTSVRTLGMNLWNVQPNLMAFMSQIQLQEMQAI